MGSVLSTVTEHASSLTRNIWSVIPTDRQLDARTALVFTSSLLLGYVLFGGQKRSLPPGPFAYPVVGNMPQLAGIRNTYKFMLKLRQQHGDIVRLKVGALTLFVIFGPELVRDVMVNKGNSVINRPNWLYLIKILFDGKGIFWSNGDAWKNLRKLTVGTLRDFGVGKKSLEERILEECDILGDVWQQQKGKPFLVKPFLADAVSNIMCAIVFGERFEYADPEFRILLGYLEYLFRNAGIQVPENFFPWISYFRGNAPVQKMLENDKKVQEFVKTKIAEHRVDFDPDNLRDFIDLFLKTEQEDGNLKVSVDDVFRVTVDLFLAGSEATSTVLQWFFSYMVAFPEVQQRCYEQILKVVGNGRSVGLQDKEQLKYVTATLHETLRLGSIAPLAPPHAVASPIEVGGYKLEVGDILMFHLNSCHMDKDYWKDPEDFRPERWLDDKGNLVKHQAYLPFGLGPRVCIGEPLVQMEAFIFATNLIQRFKFSYTGSTPPNLEGNQDGITNRPDDIYMQAVPRN